MQYNQREKLCILLSHILVGASTKSLQLTEKYDDIDSLKANLKADKTELCKLMGEDNYSRLSSAVSSNAVEKYISRCDEKGIVCSTYFSKSYSKLLHNVSDAPLNLFCVGNLDLLNSRSIAVVGTRKISKYGKDVATKFVTALSPYFTITSGLAIGVDSVAHNTTLEQQGKTIAVLGSALNRIYPALNQGLFKRIIECGGLVITEYPLDVGPEHYHFPQRNRIVSGLSEGVLVCQAPIKSGTFGTVNCALEQGREVFVVPGEIFDHGFLGSNELIKSMQSAMVTSPTDIIKCFQINETVQERMQIQLDNDELRVVDLLKLGRKHFNELIALSKMSAVQLNITISNLELKGIVMKLAGNNIQLTGEII